MQLILTIENGPQPEMSGRTWRCGTEGGTLGRNPECDLVLPDPKRYTSSVHAQIEFGDDGFTLVDRSTNGTYHNSPKTLIGRNRSVSLDQGDTLYIGDFVLRVEVDDGAGAGAGNRAPDRPASTATAQFDDDPGADSRPWDNSDFSVPWDGEGTEPDAEEDDAGGGEGDGSSFSQSPEREYFAAPSASAGGGDAIPDDWDDFLTGFHDPAKVRKPEDATPRPERDGDADASPEPASSPDVDDDASDDAGDKPFAEAEPDAAERFEPPPSPRPRASEPPPENAAEARAPESEPRARAPSSPQADPTPESSAEASTPAPQSRAARSSRPADSASDERIREILEVVTEGLMGLLQGRAEIKNEFRIAQTRFVQTENNPLKFSPDAGEALKRILADEQSPGFLTGKRAFQDAFDDIQAHQLAILSAVQRAIESAVAQFDPAQIETRLERISPMSARMPGLKAAKCWSLFSLHYEEVAAKMRDDARQLFLAEFADAYEEACRAVAERRREDPS